MSDDAPAWLSHLTEWGRGFEERQASRFSELERRLDQTVTRDLFDAEKQRVNERIEQERISRQEAMRLEAEARKDALAAETKAREGLHEKFTAAEIERKQRYEADKRDKSSSKKWLVSVVIGLAGSIFVAVASWVHL